MASNKTEFVRSRTVKAYDVEEMEKLLQGAKVAQCMLTELPPIVDEESVMKRLSALTLGNSVDGNSCSTCGVGPFTNRMQQTAHYKHHWHTHNLKRKLFGKQPITLGDYTSRQDGSSSSASESETEDNPNTPASELFAAATRHCKAFFTNQKEQVFCVYRCILHQKKEEMSLDGGGRIWCQRLRELQYPRSDKWAVVMVSGGHFAGCVFAGGADTVHKTLHSYTTRRGQGQAQLTRDQHGNSPRSAGASLRRYNQEQFLLHVQEVLISWKEELRECSLIFYRAVGSINQAALFGKPSPLVRDDPRVRVLPFPTRKPSFKEVQRVHSTLASIEVYDSLELFQKALLSSSGKAPSKTGSDTSIDKPRKANKPTAKVIDRAKSRERPPRELPTQVTSSEDEGPCYIDSETPPDWIRTLSDQKAITNSRKDLLKLNDCEIECASESDTEERGKEVKKKVKKKQEKRVEVEKRVGVEKRVEVEKPVKKDSGVKIPNNVKKMWKTILDKEQISLETILEAWEGDVLAACNTQDPTDGNTALHKAAIAAKPDMVTQLLVAGGDPCIKNHQLQTPYAASPHNDTRIAFRLFQGQFPDKYNYSKSQIPGPVTAEQLEQEKERKAQQKRAKRQREKEKQVEKLKMANFRQLTDVQKKRNTEQRCFLCGAQLPKVPFEYDDCKFCEVKCLQNHRNIRPLNLSVE